MELKEVVYQAVAYVGMARADDYLHAVNDILIAAGVELPLPGQSASTPQTRFEYGKTVQAKIVGGADNQVTGHVGGNLAVGNTRAQLFAVLTVLVPYIGYPAAAAPSPRSTPSPSPDPARPNPGIPSRLGGDLMQYRPLGRTGVQVSPLCLGAMMFGPWGNDDKADSIRIIHAALDAGINFIDTADVYSAGISEQIVGEALQGRRDDVFLATKFFMPMGDNPNHRGGSRRWIIRAVEDSLRRLGTDWIDLYQVHRPSPDTDIEETLGALSDLVHQGKIRYIGSSSYAASQIVEAQWASRARNLERFVTEQPPYSILVRGIEEDILPTIHRHGMGSLSYSPLAGGWLSGRWRKDSASSPASNARPSARFDMSTPANQRKLDIVEDLVRLAEGTGISVIEMAIAFAIDHSAITSAIVGPRTLEQLESYLPAADITLSPDVLDRIDEIVAPGVTINPDDNSYGTHELAPAARRR